MARLIDADALLSELQEELEFESLMFTDEQNAWMNKGLKIAVKDVKHQPTVDAVPVVHGRWIHIVEDGKGGCYGFCSRCSTEHHADSASALKAFHRYCRWCGADMRERGEGE